MPKKEKTVYIVHAVDVEGPMTETLEATFERMRAYGLLGNIAANRETLEHVQAGKLKGIQPQLAETLKKVFNRRSLSYLTSWKEIDGVIQDVNSERFRRQYCSKDGGPYILSWFIYDHHEGFSNNPRFHETGTHAIFDHYREGLKVESVWGDGVYWHYHHPPLSGDALEYNTCWTNRTTHEEIICRRILERNWYFSCFRAGELVERNDLSHWLEMFVPFDFTPRYSEEDLESHSVNFDWRGCPKKWGAWHPDWYDYRKEGTMKRSLFRCADLWTYISKLKEEEVEEAFQQADVAGNAVLTYFNHDYRDMRPEIEEGYAVIQSVAKRYPDITWKFVNALEAAQLHLGLIPEKPTLSCRLEKNRLWVECEGKIFGPQPFLAINENGKFFRDNFVQEKGNRWSYRFRKFDDVEAFGVAANSPSGLYDIKTVDLRSGGNA